MANMGADLQRLSKNEGNPISYGVKGGAAVTIYKGGVIIMDVSDSNYVQKHASTITATSSDVFLGIAAEGLSVVAADTDGSKSLRVWRKGVFAFVKGALTIGDRGKAVYASDDGTVTLTSSNNVWIGYLVDVDGTYAWVEIDRAAGMLNSAT